MGKYDYSLDLGKDIERISKIEKAREKEEEIVETKESLEKPQYLSRINKTHIIMLVLLLFLGFQYLTLTDKLYFFDINANIELTNQLKKSITTRKLQSNPLIFSQQELQKEVLEEFNQVKKTTKFKELIRKRAEQLKEWHKDEEGQVYLYKIDPYYYYRMAKQYLEWGQFEYPGTERCKKEYTDERCKKIYTDPLRSSPRGEIAFPTLLPYFIVYFYKILLLFNNVSLMTAAFYLPVIFGLLSIICFFFIAHKLFNNDVITFCTTLLFTLNQRFFIGNYAGNTDTQILAFFFSMLTILLLVYFIDFKNKIRSIFLFFLFYPVLVLFSNSWPSGWKYILVIILGFITFYTTILIINSLINKKFNYYYLLVLFIPLLFIKTITGVISRALVYFRNDYGVGELAHSSLNSIAQALGGITIFSFAIITGLYLIYKNLKKPNKYEVLTLSWFIPLLIAGILGRRFTYFLAPSFCLLAGYGFFYTYPYIIKLLNNFALPIKKKHNKWLICILLSVIIISVLADDILASRELFPETNDAIYNTAKFINENSKENAIIFTGKNRGYIWQALAMRGTILDGAQWGMAKEKELFKALSGEDEEKLNKYFKISGFKYDLPSNILELNFSELNNLYANEVNNKTKDLFIVIDKDTFSALSNYDKFRASKEELLYKNIKHLTISEVYDCFSMPDEKLLCGANFVVDIKKLSATQKDLITGNEFSPDSLVVVKNGTRQEKTFENGVGNFTLFVLETNQNYKSFFVDKKLKNTLTARMYAGEKIKGFKKVHEENLPERIVTYKIL